MEPGDRPLSFRSPRHRRAIPTEGHGNLAGRPGSRGTRRDRAYHRGGTVRDTAKISSNRNEQPWPCRREHGPACAPGARIDVRARCWAQYTGGPSCDKSARLAISGWPLFPTRKSPSCAGLASLSCAGLALYPRLRPSARRPVVDNQAKLGHNHSKTSIPSAIRFPGPVLEALVSA